MQLSFRWFSERDRVALADIRQVPGVVGIVSALHDVPAAVAWAPDAVVSLRQRIEDAGFGLTCIESIPVPEVVKLGAPGREAAAEAWCRSVEAVGAEAAGVRLAIHPDDPPWPLFGLPRVVTSAETFERVCALVDSPANGVTFCTGSLGADPAQAPTLAAAAGRLAARGRLHFVHLRNVARTASGTHDFTETAHPSGDVDLAAVVHALASAGFSGPLRPDHGRQIWSERRGEPRGSDVRPGYGLYDRALGATYLLGLWEASARSLPSRSPALRHERPLHSV